MALEYIGIPIRAGALVWALALDGSDGDFTLITVLIGGRGAIIPDIDMVTITVTIEVMRQATGQVIERLNDLVFITTEMVSEP